MHNVHACMDIYVPKYLAIYVTIAILNCRMLIYYIAKCGTATNAIADYIQKSIKSSYIAKHACMHIYTCELHACSYTYDSQ